MGDLGFSNHEFIGLLRQVNCNSRPACEKKEKEGDGYAQVWRECVRGEQAFCWFRWMGIFLLIAEGLNGRGRMLCCFGNRRSAELCGSHEVIRRRLQIVLSWSATLP